jgi:hypothetical protein
MMRLQFWIRPLSLGLHRIVKKWILDVKSFIFSPQPQPEPVPEQHHARAVPAWNKCLQFWLWLILYSVKFNNLHAIFLFFHCIGQSTKGEPDPEPEPHYVGAVLAWINDVAPVLALTTILRPNSILLWEKSKNWHQILYFSLYRTQDRGQSRSQNRSHIELVWFRH